MSLNVKACNEAAEIRTRFSNFLFPAFLHYTTRTLEFAAYIIAKRSPI